MSSTTAQPYGVDLSGPHRTVIRLRIFVMTRYRIPKRPEDRNVSGIEVGDWYVSQAIDLKFDLECCSHESLSFHYVDSWLMVRLYHLVYSCPKTR